MILCPKNCSSYVDSPSINWQVQGPLLLHLWPLDSNLANLLQLMHCHTVPPISTASGQHSSSVVPCWAFSEHFQPCFHLSQYQPVSHWRSHTEPSPFKSRILHTWEFPPWSVTQHLYQAGCALVPIRAVVFTHTQLCPSRAWSWCIRLLAPQTFLLPITT